MIKPNINLSSCLILSMIKWVAALYRLCPAVVLPPLPGEEGEIYDDVIDPNLEVKWEFSLSPTLLTQKMLVETRWSLRKGLKIQMQVFSPSVGSLSPRTPGLLRRNLVASCGCLTGTDALPALKSKIHSVVRLFPIYCPPILTPNPKTVTHSDNLADFLQKGSMTSPLTEYGGLISSENAAVSDFTNLH